MADKPRQREDDPREEPEYQAPKAEELPEADTTSTASGTFTGSDAQPSDVHAKTGFAEVDVHAVLAAVRRAHDQEGR